MRKLILILIFIPTFWTSTVFAYSDSPLSKAPPELDEQQASRWINSLPTARIYLARLYGVSKEIAKRYGARYKCPSCGSLASPVAQVPIND